jgi:hypothetical protein
MMTPETRLKTFLRLVGAAAMLAAMAVVMPREWMDLCHRWLGLGPLPEGPIVEYLARSTSMFYAFFGVVLWMLAADVRRYGRAIALAAVGMMVAGPVMLMIDLRAGLPGWWITVEGPVDFLFGVLTLALRKMIR